MDPRTVNDGLLQAALKNFPDEHGQETVRRAHSYVANRIAQGQVVDEDGVRLGFAAFADGFCTGFHRGNGTTCTRG